MDLDCRNTFIAVSDDCETAGEIPRPRGGLPTAAQIQHEMLTLHPYRYTQEDVLFESSTACRNEPEATEQRKQALRADLFSRPQACLRASPLPKRYGWGIHFDADGRGAAYAAGTSEYARYLEDASLTHVKGMRSKRA